MPTGKLDRKGLPLTNVTPNGPVTGNITPGRTIETVRYHLQGTSMTHAMIRDFKMRVNSKPIQEFNGADLLKINGYRGEPTDPAFLEVQFCDFSMIDDFDRSVGAFDTSASGAANITVEFDIVGATAPVITPLLVESASQRARTGEPQPYAGLISKLLKYPYSIANGGQLPMDLPFGPGRGSIIKRVHVFHGGNMTGATVKEDSLVIHESTKARNERAQVKAGRVPQPNMYTIDFVREGSIKNAFDTRNSGSVEWLFDFSGADNGTVYIEYIDPLGNL
ncbi:major capsid protein P2 [Leptospira sp. 96542]|nr:major capsid protein P2 [Leptospira sp. 96542]